MLSIAKAWLTRGGLADNLFNWQPFASELAKLKTTSGQRIVLAPNMYWPQFLNMYTLLAVALKLRGAQVDVVINDAFLPACEECVYRSGRAQLSHHRLDPMRLRILFKPLGVNVIGLSSLVTQDQQQSVAVAARDFDLNQLDAYAPDGIPVGEHAKAGALRFFAKGTLETEPDAHRVLRRYLEAALLTKVAFEQLFKQTEYQTVVAHHGIYIPQGIVGAVARKHNVHVVNWNVAYRQQCFVFSHDDTYHHTLMTEPTEAWDQLSFTPAMDTTITNYLQSRQHGSKDWISFNRAPQEDKQRIIEELGVETDKPSVALLTNVIWDAQLHYEANVFPNMIDWVMKTIAHFIQRPDLQLIIRIHPAEVKGTLPSRQPMLEEIRKHFPTLPKNIIVIPPNNPISTYVVASFCDSAIIYGTKTGVELVTTGLPVIVAGEAWIKNKGLTTDPASEAEYFKVLDTLPLKQRLTANIIERGKRYAYHFFYRRMIPVKAIRTNQGIFFGLTVNSLADIQPGADAGLDVICSGILAGEPFIYKHEQLGSADTSGYALDLR